MSGLIAQEWVASHGGSESVFRAMASTFPDADLLTLWDDMEDPVAGRRVKQSWMAGTPLRRHKAAALPLMPVTWRHVASRRRRYDWLLSSSHAFAHHLRHRRETPLYAYVHTPARYVWDPGADARGASLPARAASTWLRSLDRMRAAELTRVAANSAFVQARIEQHWGVPSTVIHPPVDVERFRTRPDPARLTPEERRTLERLPDRFVLGVSRFVAYKRLDLIIDSAERTGLPTVIAGDGPERAMLQDRAGKRVELVLRPSDRMLEALYHRAGVLAFPAVEDFGIIPIEAMAAGTPVVANRVGGTAETVLDGVSGMLVDPEDPVELDSALRRSLELDRAAVPADADRFGVERFQATLKAWVDG